MYAVEITLTRAVGTVELRTARQEGRLPLAASGDRKRLAVLVSAQNEPRAMKKIWRRLQHALPIDVLCSMFPGPDGKYLMSIPMADEVWERVCGQAVVAGKTPEDFLSAAVAQALARDWSDRRARLDRSLDVLLRAYTPEEVTEAAARRIDRRS
ncbi:hypothetical protein [Streptomyces olivochromogenes]|uniref:hypothetical protein n=1 Tax=Streptomyces olivochromogenes TaxID=1963 RepID=UPI001F30CB3A|nr:hypothetical protein [Streptomyces olivochromogenes]